MRRRWVIRQICVWALVSGQAWAGGSGEPAPYPQFTFKRVGLPQTGTPRIKVQIDPAAQAAALAAGAGAAGPEGDEPAGEIADATADGAFGWFWTDVAADMDNGGPANLARALAALRAGPATTAPRLQDLQDIAAAHGQDILRATVGTDISPALVVAMISVESSGRRGAVSDKGAAGLMQLIPDTAARFGVSDATDPSQNIQGGVAYMAWLMQEFARDPILALAGYNAGENAVKDNGGVPPYTETRAYVPKVLAAWQVARGLCLT
ncbi:MAG TPA: lytic transglycosylase domain-containing protein, partial [Aliiroseovarius sp.]|nr:lytic transglycosylase domain-containing protein [Aliiroseovarius sp.]